MRLKNVRTASGLGDAMAPVSCYKAATLRVVARVGLVSSGVTVKGTVGRRYRSVPCPDI